MKYNKEARISSRLTEKERKNFEAIRKKAKLKNLSSVVRLLGEYYEDKEEIDKVLKVVSLKEKQTKRLYLSTVKLDKIGINLNQILPLFYRMVNNGLINENKVENIEKILTEMKPELLAIRQLFNDFKNETEKPENNEIGEKQND